VSLASYPLRKVRWCLKNKKYRINPDVIQGALIDFGYKESDIIEALLKLNPNHFKHPSILYHKKTHDNRNIPCDQYIAHDIIPNKELYTHFYIDQKRELLIINSFHK
jgi:hypothetical protein